MQMSILAIAGLLVGAADAAASAGPQPQHACRAATPLASDATPESERPPDRGTVPQGALEPLDDAALRRALYGNYVSRDMTGIYDAGGLEFFCSNGAWGELGGRVSFGGPFTISNGVVCVAWPRESTCCRRFYIDAADQYFYELEPFSRNAVCGHYTAPDADPSSLIPVTIFPRRKGPDSCR